GEPRGDDARMLGLLEPLRGRRGRVCVLLAAAGVAAPRLGSRMPLRSFARHYAPRWGRGGASGRNPRRRAPQRGATPGHAPRSRPPWLTCRMNLPVSPPVEPMLAKSVPALPTGEGMIYEPKWDGFRCLVFRDGDEVELASRGGKTLTRYFPEMVAQARTQLPPRCVIDGELVVIRRGPGGSRLD